MSFSKSQSPLTYKVRRIRTPNTEVRGKRYLSEQEAKRLLQSEDLIWEEKLDGRQKMLENPEHPELVFIAEDMRETHTIHYRNLPAALYFFDIFDRASKKFLPPDEKVPLILEAGGIPANIISVGSASAEEAEAVALTTSSTFPTSVNPAIKKAAERGKIKLSRATEEILERENFIEGVVLKSYKARLMGKVVNPAFEELIDKAGRYERYPCRNLISFFSIKDYTAYVNNILSKLSKTQYAFEITERKLEKCYTSYLCSAATNLLF